MILKSRNLWVATTQNLEATKRLHLRLRGRLNVWWKIATSVPSKSCMGHDLQINKKNPATHTFLIVTRHKLVCSPMACPAALIPCRGINSVRTWSRSLLTLCIQATSTANHLAKEIGRYRKRPETSKISWETNDVAAEWSISQLSQPLNGGHRPCHRRVSRRLHGSSDSEAHKTKTSFQRPRRPHLTMASEGKQRHQWFSAFYDLNSRFSYGLLKSGQPLKGMWKQISKCWNKMIVLWPLYTTVASALDDEIRVTLELKLLLFIQFIRTSKTSTTPVKLFTVGRAYLKLLDNFAPLEVDFKRGTSTTDLTNLCVQSALVWRESGWRLDSEFP